MDVWSLIEPMIVLHFLHFLSMLFSLICFSTYPEALTDPTNVENFWKVVVCTITGGTVAAFYGMQLAFVVLLIAKFCDTIIRSEKEPNSDGFNAESEEEE